MSMTLETALGIATGGLAAINQGFGVISGNVANANTVGYATEETTQSDLDEQGLGMGVVTGATRLVQDQPLQNQLYAQNAASGAAQATDAALASLQPVLGTVGAGDDLGSLLTGVQTSFSALLNDPGSQTQQGAVIDAAQQLTDKINTLSAAYGQARQAAQSSLAGDVASLNTGLANIGALSRQIVSLQAQGESTADLQNQRNQQASAVSSLVDARFVTLPNGDMQVFSTGGAQLPTSGGAPLSVAAAQTGVTQYYPGGGLPGIMLGGSDVSGELGGGAIGADLTLRDSTIPTYQGELDEFSQNLASRFQAQGLTLFSDSQGNVPAGGGSPVQSGYLGFSAAITVNPAVAATPSLVRDGTQAVAGSATGASAFTPNPTNQAGFSAMIERVLDYALGSQVQDGVAQTPAATTGLGASGTLSAPFGATLSLGDYATATTASQAADSAQAASLATEEGDTKTAIAANLQNVTGVSMDSQMSMMVQLQNAYGANAKIIGAVQSMYTTLLNAVQG